MCAETWDGARHTRGIGSVCQVLVILLRDEHEESNHNQERVLKLNLDSQNMLNTLQYLDPKHAEFTT